MISDTPGRGGGGRGGKKGQIFEDVLYGWPLGVAPGLGINYHRDNIAMMLSPLHPRFVDFRDDIAIDHFMLL